MNPKYRGKTPEEILSMLTLRQKAGQVLVTGLCEWKECEIAMEKGYGAISAVWGRTMEDMERFRNDMKRLQKEADLPFIVGVDMETGVGQTVHEKSLATEFAEQMALGAIEDLEDAKRLAYEEGKIIASEASYLGWNMTYGPVVDVNINPENPITNIRSVGEDPELVAILTGEMIRGMQEGHRLLATAKHFPGAGMQFSDSHFALERTKVTKEEMDSTHLYPFRKAIENGVQCMMCNHAIYPMYDEVNVATTSKAVMTDLLRGELGFDGIMITDAMGMAGLTSQDTENKHMGTIRAIAAGCDLILGPHDAWNAPAAVEQAVLDGILPEERLNEAVLHVLKAKKWLGLFDEEEPAELPKQDGWATAREIAKKSITILKNDEKLIPFDFTGKKVMVVEPTHPAMRLEVGLYTNMTLIKETLAKDVPQATLELFDAEITPEQEAALVEKAKEADVIVVGTSFRSRSGQVGMLTARQLEALHAMYKANPNIIAVVSNPYVTAQLKFLSAVVCCYSTSQVAVEAAVNVLLGKEKALGKQHVTIPEKLQNAVTLLYHG